MFSFLVYISWFISEKKIFFFLLTFHSLTQKNKRKIASINLLFFKTLHKLTKRTTKNFIIKTKKSDENLSIKMLNKKQENRNWTPIINRLLQRKKVRKKLDYFRHHFTFAIEWLTRATFNEGKLSANNWLKTLLYQ